MHNKNINFNEFVITEVQAIKKILNIFILKMSKGKNAT